MKVRCEAAQTGVDTRRAIEGPADVLDSTSLNGYNCGMKGAARWQVLFV
jgi:hypothetical protein